MTTSLNSQQSARDAGYQNIQVMRRSLTVADFGTTVAGYATTLPLIGRLPAGAQVVGGGIVVGTAFDAGGTNTMDIGLAAEGALAAVTAAYASALAATAAGFVALDDLALAPAAAQANDRNIVAHYNGTVTPATVGAVDVIIEYVTKNPPTGAVA